MYRLYLTLCLLLVGLFTATALAATYYVSSNGQDTHSGRSIAQAWATISKVNATHLEAGDSVLFEGGSVFSGQIYIGPRAIGVPSAVKGTPQNPIVVGSYGAGRAIISSDTIGGFVAYNTSGIKVERLIFRGAGRMQNKSFGVTFNMDLPDTLLEYIRIDSIDVSGYREVGIAVSSWGQTTGGFKDVAITNSASYDNRDAGITVYAQGNAIVHQNVYIGYNKAYNNTGIEDKTWSHSGSGIAMGGVDGGMIEYCESYNNGGTNYRSYGGPVGIWGYNSRNLIIQYNESHHNKTATHVDGGGFDLDGGCMDCLVQYNYSHNNDGAGFLIGQYGGAPTMKGITIRYNVTENDARKNSFAGIHLWSTGASGGVQEVNLYNNTVYVSPAPTGTPSAVFVQHPAIFKTRIINNTFQVTNNLKLIRVNAAADVHFSGNNYWSTGGELSFTQANTYTSLEDWRAATGQETLNSSPTGYSIDPELKDPGKGVTIGDPTKLYTLSGYELKESSGLIGKGLDLKKEFGIDVGKYDFFGNSLEGLEAFSIGAHQVTPSSALPVTLTTFNVSKHGEAALLEWETASEHKNRGFGVEVSLEGHTFRPLGFVASKSPNSNQKQHYTYLDTEPEKRGTRYYRLRQVDLDGTATYSDVRALVFDGETVQGIRAYPNPFREAVTLEVTAEKADMLSVTISDPLGRVIFEKAQGILPGKNTLPVPLSKQYPAGMYLLTARFGDNQHRIKLIRE